MARPFYPHEADDPDLDWLVSNFLYDRPNFIPVDSGMLPLILMPQRSAEGVAAEPFNKKKEQESVEPKESETDTLPFIPRIK